MEKWIGVKAAERSNDGDFKNIEYKCDFCQTLTTTLARNKKNGTYICKSCATEAIEKIDRGILK